MKSGDKLTQYDQHELLISAAQEIEIDWPRLFDWKIITTAKEVGPAISLVAALVGFAILCWEALSRVLNDTSFLALK
ncbi:MAG: hypothetical protein JOZ08_02295 [Verrucomicrobia bacterium]|nr:hypothetical protein [Verrucomicrobiota bacterium]MBV8280347.1 hypothetical protein [Verrucomicrobiota bacterium]